MQKPRSLLLLLIIATIAITTTAYKSSRSDSSKIYNEGWIDFNKNSKMDIYEDPTQDIDSRINDLISQMTIEEKTCQLATLYGFGRVLKDELPTEEWKDRIWKDGIGNIDEHLNGLDRPSTETEYSWPPSKHAEAINRVQRFFIEETRLGIPVDFTNEGIRGICHEKSTNFPAQIGIGSSWNRDLVKRIGEITALEGKTLGYTNIYAPILDLARDPRWGRTVECYGEDPYLVGELGVQMVKAIQSEGIASTCKHFAVYSIPKGGRDGFARTNPNVSSRELHSLYLAPFKKAIMEGNALGVMSSYNDYDGIPISGSNYFLEDLLHKEWGFNGYVVSDSKAVNFLYAKHRIAKDQKGAVKAAVLGGLNVRTDFNQPKNYILPLRELIDEGEVTEAIIDRRVYDVLKVKFLVGLFDTPYSDSSKSIDKIIRNEEHELVSLQASRESMVLLKNENKTVPVSIDKVTKILVVGPNADTEEPMISRYGPAKSNIISMLEGIKNHTEGEVEVVYRKGCNIKGKEWPVSELYISDISEEDSNLIDEAVEIGKSVDLIIAVIGEDDSMVGESKSRTSLELPEAQRILIKSLSECNKPLVGVLLNGRALTVNSTYRYCDALFEMWFPGSYGGTVLAEAIFGDYNPGGKLSVTFPKSVGQVPYNFPYKPGSQSGQSFEKDPNGYGFTRNMGALFPFGYGLSYTTFDYSDIKISYPKEVTDSLSVSFTITNSGEYDGDEVYQIYLKDILASVIPFEKTLVEFGRVSIKKGSRREIEVKIPKSAFMLLNKDMNMVLEPGEFEIMVAASSENTKLSETIDIKRWGEESKDIYILIGQSNMAGRADLIEEDLNIMDGVELLNNNREFEPAQNPINRYSTIRKSIDMQKMGPGYSFGKELSSYIDGVEIGLVVNARGGTSIKEWQPNGEYLNEIIRRAEEAKQFGTIKGILWHQGESDQGSSEEYKTLFNTMINHLKSALEIQEVPLFIGEIGKWRDSATEINKVFKAISEEDRSIYLINADKLVHKGDNTHFSRDSQITLGKRYAHKVYETIYEKK